MKLEYPMAEKLDKKEITTPEELFCANMYQLDAVPQLLIEKGLIRGGRVERRRA